MALRLCPPPGGTNTGKTYAGFQRLQQAATGVYLAPLRLLALEAQEVLLDAGVDCSLTTGEEEDCREGHPRGRHGGETEPEAAPTRWRSSTSAR